VAVAVVYLALRMVVAVVLGVIGHRWRVSPLVVAILLNRL